MVVMAACWLPWARQTPAVSKEGVQACHWLSVDPAPPGERRRPTRVGQEQGPVWRRRSEQRLRRAAAMAGAKAQITILARTGKLVFQAQLNLRRQERRAEQPTDRKAVGVESVVDVGW